ncbi:hypothetical protein NDU88_006243 [Pleurodeles waltl]|uniref:Uncharacterized protein n=1 Tax=Pleurodeles waltl TaxID=8319 RepID=A0AAV7LNJ7_PLEWA|nr:hypothetical protein NDU88_006243 [Pleurodeles waltl]
MGRPASTLPACALHGKEWHKAPVLGRKREGDDPVERDQVDLLLAPVRQPKSDAACGEQPAVAEESGPQHSPN